MAKKPKPVPPPEVSPPPEIHEATLGDDGAVVRGGLITQVEAVARRQAGLDVVVCGANLTANRRLARDIEQAAGGSYVLHPPHPTAGTYSLPHYQPDPRPPNGHTFYETPNRKAF